MSGTRLLDGVGAVVFDAYGTLFDVNSAVQRHAGAVGPEATALSEMWRTKQLEYSWVLGLMGRYEPFWHLTERALDYALARHPAVDRALRERLLDAYRDLDAYGEVPSTLAAIRARGIRTAILTNGDQPMVDRAVASAGLGKHLDAVLSVDDARMFKTHPDAYRIALDRLGVGPREVVFCSSNRWDIAGAAAFGFRPVWINRKGLPDEYGDLAPAAVLSSLEGLL
ncbi:haloacid dehalogenase type II [Methylobacterium persicinum]|uniref:(S)-2-haloacid dehalogenase n=1 Tax=Methylobacterium persicinum TaxID=374426 RepID=A0ABU0HTI9_9HYPH|nr:haloacid dehalogenase type II [Methylobacterium persicinum]MDQ0444809.1 2-haloacid dehalogenase [Methylobacterium persicinum]GJE38088.1 (S)-2-haloacid dehalogenase 4A [Methylobacterium persicinum]